MFIIPLNIDSVLLLLHSSKLAYSFIKMALFCRRQQKRFVLMNPFS